MADFKEKPILMSAPMVRATLREVDPKTETRRAINLPNDRGVWEPSTVGGAGVTDNRGQPVSEMTCIWNTTTGKTICCPYGNPGDRLWVRENFSIIAAEAGWDSHTESGHDFEEGAARIKYAADGVMRDVTGLCIRDDDVDEGQQAVRLSKKKTVPSIHMPRWASRIDLLITNVRVERLHDITEAGARAEGTPEELTYVPVPFSTPLTPLKNQVMAIQTMQRAVNPPMTQDWRAGYRRLWENINGAGSWDMNPWVWVVQFERIRPTWR